MDENVQEKYCERFVGMLVQTSECLVHIYSKHVSVLWECGFKYENVLCSSMRISCGRVGSKMRKFCGYVDSNMRIDYTLRSPYL